MIPKQIDTHMKDSLREAIGILFPLGPNPHQLIGRHAWGNRRYVGEADGRVATWRGWRANLANWDDEYRGVYIDYVPNILPPARRLELFGQWFTNAVEDLPNFVVMFVAGIPSTSLDQITSAGFTIRTIGRNAHICRLVSSHEFIMLPAFYWAGCIVKMINLQLAILTPRSYNDRSALQNKPAENWAKELEWEDQLGLVDY